MLPNGSYDKLSLFRNYFPWKNSIQPGKSTLSDGMPWMTFDAINFLRKNIKTGMKVFEYGSGGSSVFFSRLAAEVFSVEHDKNWFLMVEENISERGIKNWKGILCEPENSGSVIGLDSSDPDVYGTSDNSNRSFSFEKYARSIDKFPDNYFDLIVIDGRSRPSCIKHSISKVKKNGFILLDNADRTNYSKAIEMYLTTGVTLVLDKFGPTSHNHDFTLTMIWKKTRDGSK